jgi:hypothetical protein
MEEGMDGALVEVMLEGGGEEWEVEYVQTTLLFCLLRIRYHTELQESHTDYKTNQTLQTTPTTHKQTRPTSTTNNNTYTMVCMS